jgi:hypothetical protein
MSTARVSLPLLHVQSIGQPFLIDEFQVRELYKNVANCTLHIGNAMTVKLRYRDVQTDVFLILEVIIRWAAQPIAYKRRDGTTEKVGTNNLRVQHGSYPSSVL